MFAKYLPMLPISCRIFESNFPNFPKPNKLPSIQYSIHDFFRLLNLPPWSQRGAPPRRRPSSRGTTPRGRRRSATPCTSSAEASFRTICRLFLAAEFSRNRLLAKRRSAKRSAKKMEVETSDRARTHLAGCGVHATPRKFEMSERRGKNQLHSERDTLPSSKSKLY